MFLRYFSEGRVDINWLIKAVFPVPALPINIMGFFYSMCISLRYQNLCVTMVGTNN